MGCRINVGLSYYGSRDDTERLPQCDSPTTQTEINNETDANNENVGLSYYGCRDDTKRLPQCDSSTAHTEINNETDANNENVGLSYYGCRDDTKRLPQCDSPTTHTEINNETDAYNTNVGLLYYGSRDNTKRLPQCDSPTTQTEVNHENNTEMQRRAYCCGRLSHIIGRFKSAVTKFTNQNNIPFKWQSRYHDHIIRNNTDMNNIANYIINNPANWELDCYFMNEQ